MAINLRFKYNHWILNLAKSCKRIVGTNLNLVTCWFIVLFMKNKTFMKYCHGPGVCCHPHHLSPHSTAIFHCHCQKLNIVVDAITKLVMKVLLLQQNEWFMAICRGRLIADDEAETWTHQTQCRWANVTLDFMFTGCWILPKPSL